MDLRANQMDTNAVVNHTGGIMLFSALITDITCNIDMTWFPFDVVAPFSVRLFRNKYLYCSNSAM